MRAIADPSFFSFASLLPAVPFLLLFPVLDATWQLLPQISPLLYTAPFLSLLDLLPLLIHHCQQPSATSPPNITNIEINVCLSPDTSYSWPMLIHLDKLQQSTLLNNLHFSAFRLKHLQPPTQRHPVNIDLSTSSNASVRPLATFSDCRVFLRLSLPDHSRLLAAQVSSSE